MTSTPPEAQMLIGHQFGSHRIDGYLGRGHFSFVFFGRDTAGIEVAVKVLDPTRQVPNALPEFIEEGRLLRHLIKAANVVDHVDQGDDSIIVTGPNNVQIPLNVQYMVLERAAGSLEDLLAARHLLAWDDRLQIFQDIVRGVHQMHLADVAHRDLKSSNCLVFPHGKAHVEAKVSDLGRSKDMAVAPRQPRQAYYLGQGDLRFTAPEHLWWLGTDLPRDCRLADLYGLGSLLFEIVTGVGLTSLLFGDPQLVQAQNASIPSDQRLVQYAGQRAHLNAVLESHLPLFATETPPSIRDGLVRLLRQLCDADPARRLPLRGVGQRLQPANELQWLTNRVAIIRKVLIHAEHQATELKRKKAGR